MTPPTRAPALRVRSGCHLVTLESLAGQPVVVAFAEDASQIIVPGQPLDRVRAELRGLGAVLVVFAERRLFLFRPDSDFELLTDLAELADDELARARAAWGLSHGEANAVFVVDGDGCIRFSRKARMDVAALGDAIAIAGRQLLIAGPGVALSRRELVAASLVAAFSLVLLDGCGPAFRGPTTPSTSIPSPEALSVTLHINGEARRVEIDPRTTLLDALRERLGLTGTKKGCDMGQCGACTLLVDGRRVLSCLLLAIAMEGTRITTIEGLARGDELHPMQAAFLSEDGFQCGYCTPGQIMSAVGLLKENRAINDAEVREAMSGNICRCGAYPNIVAAIQRARRSA